HRTDDSEQSSLSLGRPTGGGAGAGGSTSGYRHYHAARPVDGWAAHTAALGGADSAPRLMVDSTSTRHTHIGTPQHGGVGTSTTAPLLVTVIEKYYYWGHTRM
uniref:Peptidase_S8 domain-containing protein n=1 Tax=Globodera pallida TaxID=36090 RepID=A0A183CTN7_GLOPA